ncbi:Helicase SKI2W, partial [Orchesella cincta]
FDVGLPPVSGEISELLEPYLRLEDHPLHSFRQNVTSVKCPRDVKSLLEVNATQLPLIIKVKRNPATGQLISYYEAETSSNVETPHNSLSLNRAPGRKTDGLKGSSANLPFWPGGFDEEKKLREATNKLGALEIDKDEAELFHELFEKGKDLTIL